MHYAKWGFSLLGVLILSGCHQTQTDTTALSSNTQMTSSITQTSNTKTSNTKTSNTETSQTTNQSSTTNSETTSSTSSTNTTTTEEVAIAQTIPVGTFKNADNTLTIEPNGTWQFSGAITSSGTLTIAAETDHTWLLKLYGFNNNIDGIGTYQLAVLNDSGTKMNFGYLGTFTRTTNATSTFDPTLYQANVLQTPTDFNETLIGTWTTKNKDYDFQTTYNFNPDGTFERFSDGKGIADSGTYTATFDLDVIHLNLVTKNQNQTFTYQLQNGELIDPEFPWATLVRNTVPTTP